MIFTAQSMIVSVRSPRKSNFTSPAASTSSLSNCVTTLRAGLVAEQRREIGEHRRRDHDAAGMHAGVAHQPSSDIAMSRMARVSSSVL